MKIQNSRNLISIAASLRMSTEQLALRKPTPPPTLDPLDKSTSPTVAASLADLSRRRARSRATHRGKRGRPISA